jgi:hypothetical protein
VVALARTVGEARDLILKRVGALEVAKWQTIVLDLLNDAVVFVSAQHDWDYLRKKGTLTISTSDGTASLAADVDRVLSLHTDGANYFLTKKSPLEFEKFKENTGITEPMFYCVQGYSQDTTAEPPNMDIEIFAAPDNGTEFDFWYIKVVDELTNVNVVPNFPVHIWDLMQRKALLEALKMKEAMPSTIRVEEGHFAATLERYKKREDFGSSKRDSIRLTEQVSSYRAGRYH